MATEISIEEAIEFARAHDNRSKYAKKRANQIDISNGKVTKTVHKDDAVAALVYSGNVKYGKDGMVHTDETPLDATLQCYYPVSFEAETRIIESMWLTNNDIIGVVGKAPKFSKWATKGILTYEGILRTPFVGNNPTPSEERRSRTDIRKIASINRYVERKRVTTTIRASEINGVLPCWQTRTTMGEAEPFIMDSGQCTSCAFAVMGYNDTYCDDAIAKSKVRISESLKQQQQLFGDGESRYIKMLRETLAHCWIAINADIQERYTDYKIDIKVHNLFNDDKLEPMGFMKYQKSIIDEYAELTAKVDKVEAALDYAEYTLSN